MNATKNRGVVTGREIAVAKKAVDVGSLILSGKRSPVDDSDLEALDIALQAFWDRQPLSAAGEVLKPATFAEFLLLPSATQGMFNQLESETAWWLLLDQIEESCFLQPDKLAIARQFLVHMFPKEIAAEPYQPPKDWQYLPVPEAVERFKDIFGSSLKADASLKLVKDAISRPDSEGILTSIKLTTLGKLLGVEGNPLEATEEGLAAYAKIVELFVPKVGEAYVKALSNKLNFANWRAGNLTANHIVLTPASRATWQGLESASDDDFVMAPANTGSLQAGYSHRKARLAITASGNKMPQDCIMTGGTLAIQPDRLCKGEHLRIDNPGNAYSPGGGGKFLFCVHWYFHAGARGLVFGSDSAVYAVQFFGSAVLLRP